MRYGEKEEMKCILSKTTTDMMKSKIRSPHLSEFVIECYITPKEFAEIVQKYDEKEFHVEFQLTTK